MKENNKSGLIKAGQIILYIYIVLLAYFLFFSEYYGRGQCPEEYRYNLVLFTEIKRFIKYRKILGTEAFVVNIIGNVLAFAPLGFLLPMLNKKYRKFIIMLLISCLFSLSIELIQLSFKVGSFDVDDIFLNTIGGVIGYLAFSLIYKKCNLLRKSLVDDEREK